MWHRSMKVALLGKNKMGLVDGSCPKDKFPGLECIWKRVNLWYCHGL